MKRKSERNDGGDDPTFDPLSFVRWEEYILLPLLFLPLVDAS